MKIKEAINIMSQMLKDEEGYLSDEIVEAHKIAIQALDIVQKFYGISCLNTLESEEQ